MRRISTLLLSALLFTASCGGGSSDPAELVTSGDKALGSMDFATALQSYEGALTAIGGDTSHPQYFAAKIGEIEARAATDAAKAKDDLIALSESNEQVSDKHFSAVIERMSSAGKYEEATALLKAGIEKYGRSDFLDKVGMRLAADAKKSNATGVSDDLAGLGYLGE